MPTGAHLTTPIVWTCTGILVVLDLILGLFAWRMISREQFKGLRPSLILGSGVFYLLVWGSAMRWAWDWFYAYLFPPWARAALPPLFGLGYALIAWAMAWLSLKLRGHPALTWSVLGGVEGLLSHLFAIYKLGAATKPPIMQGTDPFAVLIFAVFEKAFYWSLILLVSWFVSVILHHRRNQVKPVSEPSNTAF